MNNDDRDALLIRLDERTKSIHEFAEKIEPRVSHLEQWRWKIAGALGVIGAGIASLGWELHR